MTRTFEKATVVPGSQIDVISVLHAARIAEAQFCRDIEVWIGAAEIAKAEGDHRRAEVFEGMGAEFQGYVDQCDRIQRVLGAASTGAARLVLVTHGDDEAEDVHDAITEALEAS